MSAGMAGIGDRRPNAGNAFGVGAFRDQSSEVWDSQSSCIGLENVLRFHAVDRPGALLEFDQGFSCARISPGMCSAL